MDQGEIQWQVEGPHKDHLEFSGEMVSGIITYGVNSSGNLILDRKVIWPMLRTIPNDTHASLIHNFGQNGNAIIWVNGRSINVERPTRIKLDGTLNILSETDQGITIEHTLFPSTTHPLIHELVTITNTRTDSVEIEIQSPNYTYVTDFDKGVYGQYTLEVKANKSGDFTLGPGDNILFSLQYSGRREGQLFDVSTTDELQKRRQLVASLNKSLVLESPEHILNSMFEFAKLRGAESIFNTKGGYMHGPGGSRYYAAIWANDQAEYINPFFPFLGYSTGNESAINSFRHFARFMNERYEPIPSSIIAEGTDIWNGAGDRGDQAMIAYGAARFALAYGEPQTAEELFPLIEWCLEYLYRKTNSEGVVESDSDELEGRFPAGSANLNTNMLTYAGLISAADLAEALGKREGLINKYRDRANQLRKNVERYFGANMHGFETYKYFKENVKLRAWICVPLAMGIFERKPGTIDALLSSYLWNENGVYSEEGNTTFWDRATLYAFRGLLFAGEVDTAMKYLLYYSRKRLLGDHVPYAVEAWPEGNQRHLSAESGLYCRVITEGLFGIEPVGFRKFRCAPRLPSEWNHMALRHIKAFGNDFDIDVKRTGQNTQVSVKIQDKEIFKIDWDGVDPIDIDLSGI